jgi:hypothetical protein
MFVRRRPLLRAAVIGGSAYVAGKRSAQRSVPRGSAAQTSVPKQAGEMSQEEAAPPSVSDQLAQLSHLHAQGSLSDAEFAAAKSRLLGH